MTSENKLSKEYAAAASGLAATSCSNALSAMRIMSQDGSALDAVARIHQLRDHAQRIQSSLEVGEDAYNNDFVDTANLEWANALVLMDALAVNAGNILEDDKVKYAAGLQKSGKTA